MTEVAVNASPASEKRFAAVLEHRFFLRVHMTAMLMLTVVGGILADKLLGAAGLRVMSVRYFLSVVAAYAVFVSSVKLWLLYLGFCVAAAAKRTTSSSSGSSWFDSFDFSGGGSSSSGSGSVSPSFSGGGGKFGGGGATGSWGDSDSKPSIVPAFLSQKSSSSSSSHSGGGGGSSDDLGELILIVLVILLVVAIIASFLWLIWAAPTILSETAFNAVLAGALAKHANNASRGSWIGSVVKKTILPFLGILVLATVLGWFAQYYCPDAAHLADAIHCANPAN